MIIFPFLGKIYEEIEKKVILIKSKYLILVLVLISILSIGAVSAVDDVDIETDVLYTTDDLSVDTVYADESSSVEEIVDLSADDASGDDDLESNMVDESVDLSTDASVGDLLENNPEINYETVYMSNIEDYFYNNGSLIGNDNLEFVGGFTPTDDFNMFIIDKTIKLNLESAYFVNIGFNITAPNVEIKNTSFDISQDYLNTSAISINADNITVDNIEALCYVPYDNDFIFIDVFNSNNTSLSHVTVTYMFFVPMIGDYSLENFNYIFRLVNSNYSSIKQSTFIANLPLKSVNYNVYEFPSIDTDLVAVIAAQNSNHMNLSNNNIQVAAYSLRSLYYPTMDTIIIVKSDNCTVSNNIISVNDLNANGSNYLYALDMYELSDMTVFNNTISMNTNGGVLDINGSGAAYPIQITGPIGSMFIHHNKLTTVNCGPNLGIYSQNYYGDTNLTIYSNIINVTGRATDNYYSLVSGMELEDTYAEVYNNTINVVNDLVYSQGNNIYGISYYQTTYNNPHVFKVYNNTIVTNGHYAVYLKSSSGTQVYNNSLMTQDLCCNDAVFLQSGSISDNYCPCANCTCNQDSTISNLNQLSTKSILANSNSEDIINEDETENIYTIYVGPNSAEDGGNGTIDNPFNDLKAAFDSVSSYGTANNIANVTINIFGGTYFVNSKSITSNKYINYIVQAMPNEIVFINGTKTIMFQSDINTTNVSTKIIGINFDAPLNFANHLGLVELRDCTITNTKTFYLAQIPAKATMDALRNFVNCTFIGQPTISTSANIIKPYRAYINISNCNFININSIGLYGAYTLIVNSVFDNVNIISGGLIGTDLGGEYVNDFKFNMSSCIINNDNNVVVIDCQGNTSNFFIENNWWGANEIGSVANFTEVPSTYAIFNASSNYLGNNQWEIIGKLTWNDGSVEGIENFAPMNVLLSSESGTFNESNPVLENGIFKVTYTGDALANEITATLDREVQTLSFNIVDLSVLVDDISYGEYANVTVDAPDNINGNFTITVNNVPYTVQTTEKSFVVPITELLSVGTYTVDVVLVDAENNIYGSNSTTFEVKKAEPKDVDSVLDVTVPSDATSASFSIDLPGATGNLIVTVNNKNYTKELVDGKATVDITDLPAGTYNAVITYSGDDNFAPISKNATVTIKSDASAKIATKLSAPKVTATYNVAKKLVITLKDANGNVLAGKKVSVKVGSITKTLKTNAKGQVSLNVAKLVPKTYTATVKFAGDSNYAASTLKPKVVVKKAKVKLAAKAKTFKAKVKTKKYTVTLKNNKGKVLKKVKLTLKIGKKTYKAKTNSKGKATFKITKLTKKGKKTATVKFAGSKYYKALSKKVKITIK